jgi:hypothetical protein
MKSSQNSPHWRWDAAKAATQGTVSTPRGDAAVAAAQRFWHRWARCRTALERNRVARQMPNVFAAFAIFDEDRRDRHALEARILANEPLSRIAAKTGFSGPVIQTYEEIFFDVRSRLDQVDFIWNHVIGQDSRGGQGDQSVYRFWKRLAYTGGAGAFDALHNGPPRTSRPTSPTEVDDFLEQEAQRALTQKFAQAVQSLDAESVVDLRTITMGRQPFLKERREKEKLRESEFAIGMQACLASINNFMGTGSKGEAQQTNLQRAYSSLPAEIRAGEMIRLDFTGQGPTLEEMANIRFPTQPDSSQAADVP